MKILTRIIAVITALILCGAILAFEKQSSIGNQLIMTDSAKDGGEPSARDGWHCELEIDGVIIRNLV